MKVIAQAQITLPGADPPHHLAPTAPHSSGLCCAEGAGLGRYSMAFQSDITEMGAAECGASSRFPYATDQITSYLQLLQNQGVQDEDLQRSTSTSPAVKCKDTLFNAGPFGGAQEMREPSSKKGDIVQALENRIIARENLQVKVLFFARAREIVGRSETVLKLEKTERAKTVNDCAGVVTQQFPALKEISSCMIVALNQVYAEDTSVIKDGDELAFIPPISGG